MFELTGLYLNLEVNINEFNIHSSYFFCPWSSKCASVSAVVVTAYALTHIIQI